jgi:hypothetical protein
MKKILSFIVLLAISSMLSFGQNSFITKTNKQIDANQSVSLDEYFKQNVINNTKATFLINEGFESSTFPPTGWTVQNFTSVTTLQWMPSTVFHSGAKAAQVNSQNPAANERNEWLISPQMNLTTINNPCLKFWWNMSYYWSINPKNNYDVKVKVSTDGGLTWSTIWAEDSAGVFTSWEYNYKIIPLDNYATSTNFKIAFQYLGVIAADAQASVYIDDVSVYERENNELQYKRVWVVDGYTEIPVNQVAPISMVAEYSNTGGKTQKNVQMTAKEISTNTILQGPVFDSVSSNSIDTAFVEDFFSLNTPGEYKLTSWLSSDSVPVTIQGDTLKFKITNAETFSRDNNIYYTSKWNEGDAYTVANLYELQTNDTIFGVKLAVNLASKAGSSIKGGLYSGLGQSKILIAESDYHVLLPSEIPTAAGTAPIIITLPFTTPFVAQVDSFYWAGMTTYGGTDTVKIAVDNALIPHSGGIPQYYYNSSIFDNVDNKWYVFSFQQQAAMVIRLSFDHTIQTVGINELLNNINLFSCMPNPANNSTRISYELKNSENVTILLTDITGRTVMTLNEGSKSAGNHVADINLTDLTSGTYFYTLKTGNSQATKKMVIVKR